MTTIVEVTFDEEQLKRFADLPLDTAKIAWRRAVERATIDAHRRAIEHKPAVDKRGAAVKRKFLTPSQRGMGEPRGVISAKGFVPVDTGRLRNSIEWKFEKDHSPFGDIGIVYSPVEYAPEMEAMFGFFAATEEEVGKTIDDIMYNAVERAKLLGF